MEHTTHTPDPKETPPGPPLYLHLLLLGLILIVGALFLLKIRQDVSKPGEAAPDQTQTTDDFAIEHLETSPPAEVIVTTGTPGALENLQSQLETRLEELSQLHGGQWALSVENLTTDACCTVQDGPYAAGSLLSLYIMGAVYEDFEALSKEIDAEALKDSVDQMLAGDNAQAAQELLLALGGQDLPAGIEKVRRFCQTYGFADTDFVTAPSLDKTGQNTTSPGDCGRFLTLLYQASEELPYPDVMLYHIKKASTLGALALGIPEDGGKIVNLSGNMDENQLHEALLVYDAPRNNYIFCLMAEHITDTENLSEDVAELSNQIYGYFNQ